MNDIEKLIKLLEHAESFSLEAYGKSPNLSECSLNIQYLRACILQAIGNAKALRERLANDKTDREIMQMALEALEVLTDNYDDNAVGIEIDAIIALRKRLAQPDPLQRLTDVQQEIEAALAPEQKPVDIGTEWTSCVKLPVTVHVRQQRPGETHVSTREGITPVKPDDLIMRGVSGEEYPIGREIFERTYQLGEAQTKPEQEPVVVIKRNEAGQITMQTPDGNPFDMSKYIGAKLYTAPPKRQPLTDEEMRTLADEHLKYQPESYEVSGVFDLIRAVSEKLEEKND